MPPFKQIVAALALAATLAVASRLLRFLTPLGSLAQFILGTLLFGIGGLQWGVPIILFFLSSSLLSRAFRDRQPAARDFFSKQDVRDEWQVVANGGVAGMLVIVWLVDRSATWYVAYLGTVAAAAADTWGTELGILSRGSPRLITDWRPVARGTSGGISLPGSAGALGGAVLVCSSGIPWLTQGHHAQGFLSAMAGALSGAAIDSLVGATIQAHYDCVRCKKRTERSTHCGTPAELSYGWRWVTNDTVNIVCTSAGAAVAALVFCAISN